MFLFLFFRCFLCCSLLFKYRGGGGCGLAIGLIGNRPNAKELMKSINIVGSLSRIEVHNKENNIEQILEVQYNSLSCILVLFWKTT